MARLSCSFGTISSFVKARLVHSIRSAGLLEELPHIDLDRLGTKITLNFLCNLLGRDVMEYILNDSLIPPGLPTAITKIEKVSSTFSNIGTRAIAILVV